MGTAPSWAKTVVVGTLFAGLVAALAAAYTRRRLAAWRARLNAYLLARKLAAPPRPKRPSRGEERAEQAFAENAPPPPRPDGSFNPHHGRGLWGEEQSAGTPTPSGYTPVSPSSGEEPMKPFSPDLFPDLPLALAAGGRLDRPYLSSRWGLGLLQWGMTTSVEMASHEAPVTLSGGLEGQSSLRLSSSLGPLQVGVEVTPNEWESRNYRLEFSWLRPMPGSKGQSPGIQTGWNIGIEWEALGPGRLWNRAVRLDSHPVVYQSASNLPGLPVSGAKTGYYLKWMPARTLAAVVAVVVVLAGVAALEAILRSSPLWVPVLLGGG